MKRIYSHTAVFIIIFLINLIDIIAAQDIKLEASVSRTTLGLDQNFEYTVRVSGNETNLPNPSIPNIDDLALLGGPSTSTNIQYVNGKMSAHKTFTYIFQPRRLGKITIPPATLETASGQVSSNSIELTITKSAPKPKQNNIGPQSSSDSEISGENLFLKVEANKKNVYQNEQVILTYKLYFRVNVRSLGEEKKPANTGFWTEEFKIPMQPVIETEVVNGIAYQVALIRKVAVFPTRSGKLEIDPMVIRVDAVVKRQRNSRSIFDSLFDDPFGRTVQKILSSKSLVLNVKPIPKTNKPANFTGDVGRYTLSITPDKTELRANEAVSVKVKVSGTGNIKLMKPPVPKFSSDMEVYDPKESTQISRDKGSISGSKTIEYIVIPRFPGEYLIKPVTFSYFDPSKKAYVRLKSDPISLNILPGTVSPGTPLSQSSLSKQDVELLGEDIRFIKETASFVNQGLVLYKRWYYIILYFIPIIGLIVTWLYAQQREKIRSDVQLARKRKASKVASRRLGAAKKFLKPDFHKDFYREVSMALQGYACDKLNIQMADFNPQIVETLLRSKLKKADLIETYLQCLQESDFRQFSGSSSDFEEMKAFFDRAQTSVTQLEKYL
jgi:hypothetical protein